MSLIGRLQRVLVIAPHPDDEVLGCGGTMARLADAGAEVFVAVVTRGCPPLFTAAQVATIRKEAHAAHALLGVRRTFYLDQPAAQLQGVPHSTLNDAIGAVLKETEPDTLLVPFIGDIHLDHQLIFTSSLVAARPHSARFPTTILSYETLSETNWNAPHVTPSFMPDVFVDIGATLERKLQAMSLYASQVRDAPHERSLAAVRALATLRGSTVHRTAAEAFILVREVM
ncbi:MAG: PIG-L deacetylase family protein [Gammaproteobacteria bacterium]